MKKLFTILVAMCAMVAVNAQSVDLQAYGFVDNATDQNVIDELNLSLTDDLNPNAVVVNAGPDALPATDTIMITISYMGQPIMQMGGFSAIAVGSGIIFSGEDPILTADQMTEAGLEGSFELCYTFEIHAAPGSSTTDPDMSNNQSCITINRGEVAISENVVSEVSIYPNPATSVLNVSAAGYNQVEIINMLGQVVYSNSISNNAQINVSDLNDGVYFVRLSGANGTTTQKFIKK
ncbi:MAG: T9SS type A sorting domain-containing protein [Bacteroidales bacterium]|nr:T9SS type A sorting domain-containing protein [Bacteroidales bacterium]MDD6582973.1 T9SS type A sorting domain-containing protein [Bacteroidales bacterium]